MRINRNNQVNGIFSGQRKGQNISAKRQFLPTCEHADAHEQPQQSKTHLRKEVWNSHQMCMKSRMLRQLMQYQTPNRDGHIDRCCPEDWVMCSSLLNCFVVGAAVDCLVGGGGPKFTFTQRPALACCASTYRWLESPRTRNQNRHCRRMLGRVLEDARQDFFLRPK